MKISRIEIQGFKSFADRIVIRFDRDVTAIVGPNGCGKSNIADAVRWAMGEQSMKKLRGNSLEDVIFSGSETRGPMSMAEVTITFDNSDGLSPPLYQGVPEVAVTRRFYRDGTSEFYLNKVECRLRDIKELFLGTGAGAGAYSMIEQGRIGWIVTSRPEDKRRLIEEAAGITGYKVHRAAAERDLEKAEQNLLRVGDLINEIEKNLVSLKRQAQKAKRYQKYHAEMVDCELHIASHQFLHMGLVLGHLSRVLGRMEEEKLDLVGAISVKEGEVEVRRGELFATELDHGRLQESLFEENNRVTLLTSQVDRAVAETGSLRHKAVATAEEHGRHGERREGLERERGEIGSTLGEMEGRLAEDLRRKAELDEELSRCRDLYDHAGQEVNRIGDLIVGNARRRTAMSARMDEISRLVEGERRRLGDLDRERVGIEERLVTLGSEERETGSEVARAEVELRAGESLRAGQLGAVGTFKGAIRAQDGIVEADAEALSAARSRLEAVVERIGRREKQRTPVRTVQEASRRLGGSAGVYPLSESLRCREGYEEAVAAVLGHVLEALVVRDHAEVLSWREFASTSGLRSPGFVPRESLTDDSGRTPLELYKAEPLRAAVTPRPEDRDLVDRLLAGCYVVDSVETAIALHAQNRGRAVFVTLDGVLVGRGGEVLVRDESTSATTLVLESQAQSMRQQVGQLERRLERSSALRSSTRERIARATHAAEQAQERIHEEEKRLLTLRERASRLLDERDRLSARRSAILAEAEAIGLRTTALEEEVSLGLDASAQLEGETRGLEVHQAEARARAEDLRLGLERCATDARAWDLVIEGRSSERSRVERRLQEILQGVAEAEAGLDRTRLELESNYRSQGRTLGEIFRSSEERDVRLARAAILKADLDKAKARFEDLRLGIEEAEAEVRARRREIDDLARRLHDREREIVQTTSDIDRLRDLVYERTRRSLEDALYDYHSRRPPTAETEAKRDELRHLLERMGPASISAIQEYDDAVARHEALVTQRDDTQQALETAQKAIASLNRKCRSMFRDAFDKVNANFQEIFPRLFNGGTARLELLDESDLLESGVEIYAQPPGKKLVNLAAMSGGEKALTAVALIFAMFQYRPSPFCMLDEVDAPLDDVNTGRVMDMLRSMTDRSQFILVTHSKITMERADVLFGVTMEEPGITKLVSVRLSQAQRFAHPAAEAAA